MEWTLILMKSYAKHTGNAVFIRVFSDGTGHLVDFETERVIFSFDSASSLKRYLYREINTNQ